MFDINFLKATAERAIKTFIQVLVAGLGTAQIGVLDLAWEQSLSLAASAAVLSILTSLGSANLGGKAGPSLAGETTKPEVVTVEVPAAKKPAAKKTAAAKK
jgi:hypothetical protein